MSKTVVIVAVSQYDNLGAGYLSSVLKSKGFRALILNPLGNKAAVLRTIKRLDPLLVGFSVIFQYHIDLFRDLAEYLRLKGINCHFTAGGHYASLRTRELFDLMPSLDSIIRFEGEYTLSELVNCLYKGSGWRQIDSLSYRDKGKIKENRLSPLEKDIDKFPYPFRAPLKKLVFNERLATLIAGRGCINNCSFCNVRKFYSQPPGPLKRIRKPEMVAEEMLYLHKKRKCSIYYFLDDDFPLRPANDPDWAKKFCEALNRNGLKGKIMWKICCRPDEVDKDLFEMMKYYGLFRVFLGIEDGTDRGLKRLNKNMTVAESLKGIKILRDLEIDYDYGFMLFQPSTTFRSLNLNLDFLKLICYKGCTPVKFLKLMPYYETKVEKELSETGRLKITDGIPDYDFYGRPMNKYYQFVTDIFKEWLSHPEGVANMGICGLVWYSVYYYYFGHDSDVKRLKRNYSRILSDSNDYIINTLKVLSAIFENEDYYGSQQSRLIEIKQDVFSKSRVFTDGMRKNLGSLLDLPLKHFFSRLYPEHAHSFRNFYVIKS